MKLIRSLLRLATLLAIVGLVGACNLHEQIVIADNPTSERISFAVDDQQYTLEANTSMELRLDNGTHTLTTPTGERITFVKGEGEAQSLLNPTRSRYVIVTEAYTDTPRDENIMYTIRFKEIELDGRYFYGAFEVVDDCFIPSSGDRHWRFGLDEPFPDTLPWDRTDDASVNLMVRKIFRLPAFLEEYADSEVIREHR